MQVGDVGDSVEEAARADDEGVFGEEGGSAIRISWVRREGTRGRVGRRLGRED